MSTGVRFRLANAETRMRVPSSSRMLLDTFDRDVLEDLVGHLEPLGLRLLAEDRDAGLEVGRLHVGDQAPLEPAAHAVLEAGEVLRRHVARDHDLLVVVVQGVEGVEERLLRLRLALQELDVVDQQDVDVAVALPGTAEPRLFAIELMKSFVNSSLET